MNERIRTDETDDLEIDFLRLTEALWHRIWLIALCMILCSAMAFSMAFFFIAPKYRARAMMYVNNSSFSLGSTSFSISSSELTAAKSLLDVYIIILTSRTTLEAVIEEADLEYTYTELSGMISAEAVNGTEIFEITAVSTDPAEAELIVDTITEILPDRIAEIVDGSSVRTVDAAVFPTQKASPNAVKYAALGMLLGFAASSFVVILMELTDNTVRDEDTLTQRYQLPLLASIPDMKSARSGGSAAYYGSAKSRRTQSKPAVIGEDLSFAASEAYKRLRTKLLFSMAGGEDTCRMIGVTSALSGEGKTTTSINLALSFAQAGKRTLLIDGDMRLSSVHKLMGMDPGPGLSNSLVGMNECTEIIRISGMHENLCVMTAGEIPPNPTELLNHRQMADNLDKLSQKFDCIVIDLPPVEAVADALIVSKLVHGMLIVVRQNHADRTILDKTISQLRYHESRILGFVFNSAAVDNKYYKKSRKYSGQNDD